MIMPNTPSSIRRCPRQSLIWLLLVALLSGCQTSLKLQSDPDGATVSIYARPPEGGSWEQKDKVRTPQIYQLTSPQAYFGSGSTAPAVLIYEKAGYGTERREMVLQKNSANELPLVTLPPLDTVIKITTEPSGATISLHATMEDANKGVGAINIPDGETINLPVDAILKDLSLNTRTDLLPTVSSPWLLRSTRDYAARQFKNVRWIRVEAEGFIPEVDRFAIRPGVSQTSEFKLRPAVVNLNITSTPPGAIVEDLRPGGFGKLGETEINLQITYDQFKNRPELLEKGRLLLDLRGFFPQPGYTEWNRTDIEIPLGETYNLEFVLEPTLKQVYFTSSPDRANVYVEREITSTNRADEGRATAKVKKHLGITPLNYNIDPGDPLVHGETIFFELDGYEDTEVVFAKDEPIVHGRLVPLNPGER